MLDLTEQTTQAGLQRYEVSAYAQTQGTSACNNLNYYSLVTIGHRCWRAQQDQFSRPHCATKWQVGANPQPTWTKLA